MRAVRRHSAFTLIELLVVISILGILAALSLPAIKSLGKSNATISATRQLLDDFARARQLAMSQRTTVYMIFVPPYFWNLTTNRTVAATNLLDKQLTGYTFVSKRNVGDQPGQGQPRYLARWQSLPENTFIASNKFIPPANFFYISQWDKDHNGNVPTPIYGFATNVVVPFPVEGSTTNLPVPYIAFNYLGQLTFDGLTMADRDEYIPLARGSVMVSLDPSTRALQIGGVDISEVPPGNSTNMSYNIIHIDRLTGRARPEFYKVQ